MIKSLLFFTGVVRWIMIPFLFFISLPENLHGQIASLDATLKMNRVDYIYIPIQGGISSGVYIYKLTAGNHTTAKKMILVK